MATETSRTIDEVETMLTALSDYILVCECDDAEVAAHYQQTWDSFDMLKTGIETGTATESQIATLVEAIVSFAGMTKMKLELWVIEQMKGDE